MFYIVISEIPFLFFPPARIGNNSIFGKLRIVTTETKLLPCDIIMSSFPTLSTLYSFFVG